MAQKRGRAGNPLQWLMSYECGAIRARSSARAIVPNSPQQRRPRWIGCIARRWNSLLVAPSHIDSEQCRPRTTTGIAEEHHDAPVRRPGRSFIVITVGQDALAGSIRSHDADRETALRLLGEGN